MAAIQFENFALNFQFFGNSPVVQWLGLSTFTVNIQVQSLVVLATQPNKNEQRKKQLQFLSLVLNCTYS